MSTEDLCCIDFTKCTVVCAKSMNVENIYYEVNKLYGIPSCDYYLLQNGKKVTDCGVVHGLMHIVPRLIGGKGGFGSMLRAIGAQIEKTTNREACRDLSGRRLRDINEEQRLKNWIAQQAEREREAADRKRMKLEKLCREPKHDFKDEVYEKERSELSEKVSSSVEEGLKNSSTSCSSSSKRSHTVDKTAVKKKKKKLLIDMDNEFSSSDSDDEQCTSSVVSTSKNDKQTKSS